MQYPSLSGRLIMPEYGRNVQRMIEYALTIDDKKERTECVYDIVKIMGNLFPYLRDINNFNHKLWDHVAIMSDFKLDIDYPYEIVKEEELHERPHSIPYKNSRIKYRHYGRNLEEMILAVGNMKEGENKDYHIKLLANQMKKCFLSWNKEVVEDQKIFDDLREMSNGKIYLSTEELKLAETKNLLNNNNNNKKGKIQIKK